MSKEMLVFNYIAFGIRQTPQSPFLDPAPAHRFFCPVLLEVDGWLNKLHVLAVQILVSIVTRIRLRNRRLRE